MTFRPAFTLLELVVVLLLLSVMAGVVGPNLRGFLAGRQPADAAEQLATLCRYARVQAIAEGRPFRLNVDTTTQTYWLTAQRGGEYQRVQTEFGRTFSMPAQTAMEWEDRETDSPATRGYIEFHPSGRSEVASIRITGGRGEQVWVRCESAAEGYRVVKQTQEQ